MNEDMSCASFVNLLLSCKAQRRAEARHHGDLLTQSSACRIDHTEDAQVARRPRGLRHLYG